MIDIILDSSAGRRSSRISDLSVGGCFVESMTNYHEGEELAFELRSSDGNVLRFTGRVAYVMENFVSGLSFRASDPNKKHSLSRL
ncbi:hypothetical protein BH24ACI3_BH24ACI3_01910 [soil metagenome]